MKQVLVCVYMYVSQPNYPQLEGFTQYSPLPPPKPFSSKFQFFFKLVFVMYTPRPCNNNKNNNIYDNNSNNNMLVS